MESTMSASAQLMVQDMEEFEASLICSENADIQFGCSSNHHDLQGENASKIMTSNSPFETGTGNYYRSSLHLLNH